MLPEKHRLKINRVRSRSWVNKRELYTPFFKVIFHLKEGNGDSPRIGFIIGGKIKSAVKRNRIRRIFAEAARGKIKEFPRSSETLIITSKKAGEANYEDINSWVNKSLSKLHKSSE